MFGFHPELAPIRFGVCKKIKGHGWKPAYIKSYKWFCKHILIKGASEYDYDVFIFT